MKNKITVVSDVHQKYKEYLKICSENEYTVQLGDMGFNYERIWDLDPEYHVWFPGNHDEHCLLENIRPTAYLGRYGIHTLNGVKFFYIGGAWSIDWQRRLPGLDWFHNEELNSWEWEDCEQLYLQSKPDLVLSHDCPSFIYPHLGINEIITQRTPVMLARLYSLYQPKRWYFSHHHQYKKVNFQSTEFTVLPELGVEDVFSEN